MTGDLQARREGMLLALLARPSRPIIDIDKARHCVFDVENSYY